MATSGGETEDIRRGQEADLPSGQTPEDVPHHREAESDKEDAVLFARHKGKVFKVIEFFRIEFCTIYRIYRICRGQII